MPTLRYVQQDREDLAGHDWIWLDRPNGDRYMLMARGVEVALDDCVVAALARGVLADRMRAS